MKEAGRTIIDDGVPLDDDFYVVAVGKNDEEENEFITPDTYYLIENKLPKIECVVRGYINPVNLYLAGVPRCIDPFTCRETNFGTIECDLVFFNKEKEDEKLNFEQIIERGKIAYSNYKLDKADFDMYDKYLAFVKYSGDEDKYEIIDQEEAKKCLIENKYDITNVTPDMVVEINNETRIFCISKYQEPNEKDIIKRATKLNEPYTTRDIEKLNELNNELKMIEAYYDLNIPNNRELYNKMCEKIKKYAMIEACYDLNMPDNRELYNKKCEEIKKYAKKISERFDSKIK